MKGINIREKFLIAGLALFVMLTFLRGCENKSTKRALVKLSTKVDSLQSTQVSKNEILKAIAIEGLKSELRMIESTDRRMMDKNRQTEIRKEIDKLEK